MLQGGGSVRREQLAEGGVEGDPPGGSQTPHDSAAVGVEPRLQRRGRRHVTLNHLTTQCDGYLG